MTASDPRRSSPAELALDVLVYLPAGALLTALEDAPGMVDKGRRRVDQELRNARVVGRFAVQLGTRRLRRQIDRFVTDDQRTAERRAPRPDAPRPDAPRPDAPRPDAPTRDAPSAGSAREAAPERTAPAQRPDTPRPASTGAATAPAQRTPRTPRTTPSGPARSGDQRDAAVDRAIPEYDTLSASQVVRRLDGLGDDELRAVVRHERANRARRTVLNRADQLLGRRESGGGGSQAGH